MSLHRTFTSQLHALCDLKMILTTFYRFEMMRCAVGVARRCSFTATDCPIGQYISKEQICSVPLQVRECSACPPRTYTEVKSEEECSSCPAGSYCPGNSNAKPCTYAACTRARTHTRERCMTGTFT